MNKPFRAETQAPALLDVNGAALLPVVAAGPYRAELAQAVLSFKKHGQHHLADVLSKGLAGAIRAAAGEAPGLLLVPVPTSSGAYRKRGFSPVHLMLGRLDRRWATGAGARPGFVTVHALRRKGRRGGAGRTGHTVAGFARLQGGTGGQKGLGRGDRAQRARGSMRVRDGLFAPEVRGRYCLIIDDVLTTGATLAEASRVLGAAGALVRGAVVLAATRPPVTLDYVHSERGLAGRSPVNEKNKPGKDE